MADPMPVTDPTVTPQSGGMPPIVPMPEPTAYTAPQQPATAEMAFTGANFASQVLSGMEAAQPAPTAPLPVQTDPANPFPPPQAPAQQPTQDRYSVTDPVAEQFQPLPNIPTEQPVADPQFNGDQQGHAWAALRAQAKQNRQLAEQYHSQYNQLLESTKNYSDEKAGFAAALNEKDQQIAQLETQLGRRKLEDNPQFIQNYDEPIRNCAEEIKQIMRDHGVEDENLDDLALKFLSSDEETAARLYDSVDQKVAERLASLRTTSQDLYSRRDAELQDWENSLNGYTETASRGEMIASAQREQAMVDQALKVVRSYKPDANGNGVIPAYQVQTPEFVKARDERESKFRGWVTHATEDQKYTAMLEGFMAPQTYEMLNQVMRENAMLKQQLHMQGRISSPPTYPVAPQATPQPRPANPLYPVQNGQTPAVPYVRADTGTTSSFVEGMLQNLQRMH